MKKATEIIRFLKCVRKLGFFEKKLGFYIWKKNNEEKITTWNNSRLLVSAFSKSFGIWKEDGTQKLEAMIPFFLENTRGSFSPWAIHINFRISQPNNFRTIETHSKVPINFPFCYFDTTVVLCEKNV